MKTIAAILLTLFSVLSGAQAQLAVPGDGSDGALVTGGGTNLVDLRRAITARWDTPNGAAAGQGVYDAEKWAVVFKYSSVLVEGRLTFTNHPSRAPVVWLVQGDVTINGTIDLSGAPAVDGTEALLPREPGPGGFRGAPTSPQGSGFVMGPGFIANDGAAYAASYGNPEILPLIGGSGGMAFPELSGSGGGGAILIASRGTVTLNGSILALGGANPTVQGSGAGGAVKIIAQEIRGTGQILAHGTLPDRAPGRIRLETPNPFHDLFTNPDTIAVPPANPPIVWPPEDAPTIRVLRIGGVDTPADPTAPLARTADVHLARSGPVEIVIETTHFPLEGQVEVKGVGKFGGGFVAAGGTPSNWARATYFSGDFNRALWTTEQPLPAGYTVVQARAFLP